MGPSHDRREWHDSGKSWVLSGSFVSYIEAVMHANIYSGQTNTPNSTLMMLEDMGTGKGKATAIISDMQVAGTWDHREDRSPSQVGRASGVIGRQLLKYGIW